MAFPRSKFWHHLNERKYFRPMDDLNPDQMDWLVLNLVPGLGPRLTTALLEKFKTPRGIFDAPLEQIASIPHMGFKIASKLKDSFKTVNAMQELNLMKQHGVQGISIGQNDYPHWLRLIHDPPPYLYYNGLLNPRDENSIAIVGSRGCTDYGKKITRKLSAGLARAGWTIVSGLARGIDASAHQGALDAGGRTIAVLAGGLSKIYPPEHADLAREVAKAGALITESHMLQEPLPGMFPARNRIISGYSKAVLLIEAAEKSGALLTAVHASEQGKIVMAVPGAIDSPASAGTNSLIRKGAILVRNVEDILEELKSIPQLPAPDRNVKEEKIETQATLFPPDLEGLELEIWKNLQQESLYLDQFAQRFNLPVQQIASALMMMEMKKIVKRMPGNRFQLS